MKDIKKLVSILFLVAVATCCTSKENLYTIVGNAQGSTYSIKYCGNKEVIKKSEIDSMLQVVDMSLSNYRNGSQIVKINNGDTTVVVDDFFVKTFYLSKLIYHNTDGLFDPSVGCLVNAYGFGPTKNINHLDKKELDSIMYFVGFNKVNLTKDNRIQKPRGTQLDFNAVAQGYTVDMVIEFLRKRGIKNAMVEIGGEIFALGRNTSVNKSWILGIDNPLQNPDERAIIQKISLENLGMATSGNYRKMLIDEITGEQYVHIINPLTGMAFKNNILSATVVSESTALSDGYATAIMLMKLEDIKDFAAKNKNLAILVYYSDKSNKIKTFYTENFKKLMKESN